MARFTPTRLFRARSVLTTADVALYSAPAGGAIIKELLLVNTTGVAVTVGVGVVDQGVGMLDPNDYSFETGIGTWAGSGATIASSGAKAYLGTHSLAITGTGGPLGVSSGAYAVSPGLTYAVQCSVVAGTTTRSCTLSIAWSGPYVGVGGPYMGGTASEIPLNSVSSSNVQTATDSAIGIFLQGTAVAPANAYVAQPSLIIAGPPASGEVHYLDAVYFAQNSSIPNTFIARNVVSADRIVPDQQLPPGLTVVGLSQVMNPGDVLTAMASAPGVNVIGSGMVMS